MSLLLGTRIGPYEIVSMVGAGGMGEVYRAHDPRLGRDVALKVLPPAFASDPERVARFDREARTLATLTHPHIGAIYGVEETNGLRALALEFVEGETLADRIARGPLPLEDALPIARQIAEALAAAHEQGIVHRDLKPANIKVTSHGVIKVLDFGLAKLADGREIGAAASSAPLSPTITSPVLMTQAGALLGTAVYMSPEQAKGRPTDKRTDIWAFGCVLYEMLTGRRAFDGQDTVEVLGAVTRLEPNWSALSPDVPSSVRTLVQGCLVKDRGKRIADIAVALFILDHHASSAESDTASRAPLSAGPLWRRMAPLTAVALIAAILGGALAWLATRPAPPPVIHTTITASEAAALTPHGADRGVVITPDGTRIVYRGNNRLVVRALNRLEPAVLSGLGPAPRGAFISPDGQWIGFVDGTAMKRVAIAGGPPVTLCGLDGAPRGGTWGADGTLIFATTSPATGLQRVSAAGGEPTVLTTPDPQRGENDHVWPEFLPDGNAVLFTITPVTGGMPNAQIAVLDLRTGKSKVLVRGGSHAHYVPTGHLVYGVAGTLRAVPFDLRRREVTGAESVPVLENVMTTAWGAAEFAVATNGSLVYIRGRASLGEPLTVVSVDRQGRPSPLPGLPPNAYRDVRVSPDGAQLALTTQANLQIYDFSRTTLSQPTTDAAQSPLWTPDGRRIVFTSRRAGYPELFWRSADGTGSDERLFTRAKDLTGLRPNGWSPNGKHLLFVEVSPTSAIGEFAIDRPSDVRVLVKVDSPAAISPNGQWMAYESNESGRPEIYVERYPALGSRRPISTSGGRLPVWSRNGKELFFSSLDARQMMVVPLQYGKTVVAGSPQVLFKFAMRPMAGGSRSYDIAPDGRFLIISSGEAEVAGTAAEIVVVQNWFEELRRLVPTN